MLTGYQCCVCQLCGTLFVSCECRGCEGHVDKRTSAKRWVWLKLNKCLQHVRDELVCVLISSFPFGDILSVLTVDQSVRGWFRIGVWLLNVVREDLVVVAWRCALCFTSSVCVKRVLVKNLSSYRVEFFRFDLLGSRRCDSADKQSRVKEGTRRVLMSHYCGADVIIDIVDLLLNIRWATSSN